jgi:phage/plasmid-associated DNA primase
LDGLERLREQGRFSSAKICDDALADYRLESNPARMFLQERCEANPDAKVISAKLYEAYSRWAKANGYTPLSAAKMGGEVRRAFQKMQRRQEGRIWHYVGIAFNEFSE